MVEIGVELNFDMLGVNEKICLKVISHIFKLKLVIGKFYKYFILESYYSKKVNATKINSNFVYTHACHIVDNMI